MHFPLKIALTAVLAKSTIAELSASQTQQPNELEHQFQPPVFHHQRDFAHQTADFDQNQVGFNPNTVRDNDLVIEMQLLLKCDSKNDLDSVAS